MGRLAGDCPGPDLAGQDSTSSATFGAFTGCGTSGFSGTSAAAPHVAGAAALAKQANPGFTEQQLQAFLRSRAIDLGQPGPDNSFGAGGLSLGAPPSHPNPPASVSIGTYQARAAATDGAGNQATASAVSFSLDTTPPSVAVIAPTMPYPPS